MCQARKQIFVKTNRKKDGFMQIKNALTRQNVEGLAYIINNLKDFLCNNELANVKDIGHITFEHFDFLMEEYVEITGCVVGVLKHEYLYTPVQLKMLKDVFLLMITKKDHVQRKSAIYTMIVGIRLMNLLKLKQMNWRVLEI